jgi:hypothetical protein
MVAIFEVALLVVCASGGLWWFTRTNLFRAHKRSGSDPGQRGSHKAL